MRIWIGLGVHLNLRWTPNGGAADWGAAANEKPTSARGSSWRLLRLAHAVATIASYFSDDGAESQFSFSNGYGARAGGDDRRRRPADEELSWPRHRRTDRPSSPVKSCLSWTRPQRRRVQMSRRSRLVRRAEAQGAGKEISLKIGAKMSLGLRSTPRLAPSRAIRRWAIEDAPERRRA